MVGRRLLLGLLIVLAAAAASAQGDNSGDVAVGVEEIEPAVVVEAVGADVEPAESAVIASELGVGALPPDQVFLMREVCCCSFHWPIGVPLVYCSSLFSQATAVKLADVSVRVFSGKSKTPLSTISFVFFA